MQFYFIDDEIVILSRSKFVPDLLLVHFSFLVPHDLIRRKTIVCTAAVYPSSDEGG